MTDSTKTGKFVGNCASCGLMLAEFDLVVATQYRCPRCGATSQADVGPDGKIITTVAKA